MAKKKKDQVILTVGSKVKDFASELGFRSAGDFNAALSDRVEGLITDAADRCKANQRSTLKATDL